MKGTARPDKPTPVRLNELKGPIQMWASDEDRSAQYIIRKILEDAVIKRFGYPKDYFKKLRLQKKA